MRLSHFVLFIALSSAISANASDSWRDIPLAEGVRFTGSDYVSLRGAWKARGDYAQPRITQINNTAIVCLKAQMQCIESLASLRPSRLKPEVNPPQLLAITAEYAIKEWSAEQIVATRVNPRGGPIYSTMVVPLGKGNVRLDWRAAEDDGWFLPAAQSFEIEIKQPF